MPPSDITRCGDAGHVARTAAERFVATAREAVERSGRFVVVLAGGRTPRELYRLLSTPPCVDAVAWDRSVLLFGDERCVPPDDEDSNYRMVRETLIEPAGIAAKQVLRMEAERPPVEAATRYQLRVRDLFIGEVLARFDLVLLGVGADGHTASLFPETAALEEQRRWVAANHVPRLDAWRLTLTLPALCGARRVLFCVTGRDKARIVAEAFGGHGHTPPPHPCERVVPVDGTREILVDDEAAALL